jgi:hypothetical protein
MGQYLVALKIPDYYSTSLALSNQFPKGLSKAKMGDKRCFELELIVYEYQPGGSTAATALLARSVAHGKSTRFYEMLGSLPPDRVETLIFEPVLDKSIGKYWESKSRDFKYITPFKKYLMPKALSPSICEPTQDLLPLEEVLIHHRHLHQHFRKCLIGPG